MASKPANPHTPDTTQDTALGATQDTVQGRLAAAIRWAREQRGWNQSRVAHELPSRVGLSTYRTYEKGACRIPLDRFVEIAHALRVAPGQLLDTAFTPAIPGDPPNPTDCNTGAIAEGIGDAAPDPQTLVDLVAAALRRRREHCGYSREQVAAWVPSGINRRTYLGYETGHRMMAVTRFVEIAHALHTTPGQLLNTALTPPVAGPDYLARLADLARCGTEELIKLVQLPARLAALLRSEEVPAAPNTSDTGDGDNPSGGDGAGDGNGGVVLTGDEHRLLHGITVHGGYGPALARDTGMTIGQTSLAASRLYRRLGVRNAPQAIATAANLKPAREAMAVDKATRAHERLVGELRRVKQTSGLSYARLQAHTPYSRSSLERYINGKLFPTRQAVREIARACSADPEELLRIWDVAAATDPPTPNQTIRRNRWFLQAAVHLRGGRWGPGRLIRPKGNGWVWGADSKQRFQVTRNALNWTGGPNPPQLRARVIATFPWAWPEQCVISDEKRRNLAERLPVSDLAGAVTMLSRQRGAELRLGQWSDGPNRNGPHSVSQSASIASADGRTALSCEVMLARPQVMSGQCGALAGGDCGAVAACGVVAGG